MVRFGRDRVLNLGTHKSKADRRQKIEKLSANGFPVDEKL